MQASGSGESNNYKIKIIDFAKLLLAHCTFYVLEYEIRVSFIEIYNDQIRDLTKSKSDSNVILFSTNIKRTSIKNESSAIKLFENMKLKRKTSATNKNEHSSRSHLICTIHLTKYDHMLKTYDAEFNLVDLAG